MRTKSKAHNFNLSLEEIEEVTSRWVINVSDYDLNEHELLVLKKGLSFAVTPTKIPMDDMITAVETAVRHVGLDSAEAAEIRNKASDLLHHAKPPKSNISTNERETIRSLKRNQDIMIVPVDKGRAVVVINTVDCKILLSYNKTYVKLKSNPTRKNVTKLILQSIEESGAITDIQVTIERAVNGQLAPHA